MAMILLDIEVDRMMLLVKNIGWELVEKKVLNQKVQVTLEKDLSQLEEKVREAFWIRVRDVLNMFSWKILEETTEENVLTIRAEKDVLQGGGGGGETLSVD